MGLEEAEDVQLADEEGGDISTVYAAEEVPLEEPGEQVAEDNPELVLGEPTAVHDYAVGDAIECFWPDDEVWLPALIQTLYDDGSVTIIWDKDGSQSSVPGDYVRLPQQDAAI